MNQHVLSQMDFCEGIYQHKSVKLPRLFEWFHLTGQVVPLLKVSQVLLHSQLQATQRWARQAQCFELNGKFVAPIEQFLLTSFKTTDSSAIGVQRMSQGTQRGKALLKPFSLAPEELIFIFESLLVDALELRAQLTTKLTNTVPHTKLADFVQLADKSVALRAAIVDQQGRKLSLKQLKGKPPCGSLTITELLEEEQGHGVRLKGRQDGTVSVKEFVKLDGIEGKAVVNRFKELFSEVGALPDDVAKGAVRRGTGEVKSDLKSSLNIRDRVISGGQFECGKREFFGINLNPMSRRIGFMTGLKIIELFLKESVLFGEVANEGVGLTKFPRKVEEGVGAAIDGGAVHTSALSQFGWGRFYIEPLGQIDRSCTFKLINETLLGKLRYCTHVWPPCNILNHKDGAVNDTKSQQCVAFSFSPKLSVMNEPGLVVAFTYFRAGASAGIDRLIAGDLSLCAGGWR